MLDDKVPKAKIKSSIRMSVCSSPISDDEDFKTSTLSYLGSPTAKSLGLSGSPVHQNVAETPKSRTSSPVSPAVHRAADNTVCAPSNFPLPSRPESCYGAHARSRSPSNLFSDETIDNLTPLISLFPSIWKVSSTLSLESDSIRSLRRNLDSGKLWMNSTIIDLYKFRTNFVICFFVSDVDLDGFFVLSLPFFPIRLALFLYHISSLLYV